MNMGISHLGIFGIIIGAYLLIGTVGAVSGNGGFETGKLYPWDYRDSCSEYNWSNARISPVAAHTGSYGAIISVNNSQPTCNDWGFLEQWLPPGYILNHNITFWYKVANISDANNGIYFHLVIDYWNDVVLISNSSISPGVWTKFDMSLADIIAMPENSGSWNMSDFGNDTWTGGEVTLTFQVYDNGVPMGDFVVYIDDVNIPDEAHQFTGGGFESESDITHWGDVWQHTYTYEEASVNTTQSHTGNSSARFNSTKYNNGDLTYVWIVQEIPEDWKYVDFWYKVVNVVPVSENSFTELTGSIFYGTPDGEGNDAWLWFYDNDSLTVDGWVHFNISREDLLSDNGYTEGDLLTMSHFVELQFEVGARNWVGDPVEVEIYLDDVSIGLDANFTYSSTNFDVNFTDTSTGSPTGWAWFFGDEPYNQSWVQQNASTGWAEGDNYIVSLPNGHLVATDYDGSVWRSTDQGVTWNVVSTGHTWWTTNGLVSLSDGSIFFPDLSIGKLYRSLDEGYNWTIVNSDMMGINTSHNWRDGYCIVVLPDDTMVVIGGECYDYPEMCNDTFISEDKGLTWTQKSDNTTSGWTNRKWFGAAALPDSSIVISGGQTYNTTAGNTVVNDTWRSTDKGTTWTEISTPIIYDWDDVIGGGSGYPADAAITLFAMPDGSLLKMSGWEVSAGEVYRSTDRGATFTQLEHIGPDVAGYGFAAATGLPDGSLISGGASTQEVLRFDPTGSHLQNPAHTYGLSGLYNVTQQVYNALDYNRTTRQITISTGPGNYTRQDILMSTGYLLSLTFEDSKNFTVVQNVSILDNYGMNITAVDGTFNYTYPAGDVALIIHAAGYVDRTVQYTMYQDYTGIVLLEPEVPVQQIHQTTYFPHLVRISCMNYLGTPIQDIAVSAVVVESTGPYGWLSDIFGINTNETQIVNTTLSGSTDSDGSIAFLMVENLKYRIQFSKPAESINQTNYLYPKEGDYSYVFWSEAPPSVSGSIGIEFWNRTNLSNATYMDLGVHYTDSGSTTDWSRFTVYYENDTVLYTKNATTPNDWNISYPVYMGKGVAYIWGARANNTRYSEQIVQSQIIRFGNSPQKIPYNLCSEGDTSCVWNKWIALMIISLVAILFGRASVKFASAIIVLLALLFAYIGWLDYTPLLISTIVFLGIMFYFRYAESESDI